jgi:hypothetical protein
MVAAVLAFFLLLLLGGCACGAEPASPSDAALDVDAATRRDAAIPDAATETDAPPSVDAPSSVDGAHPEDAERDAVSPSDPLDFLDDGVPMTLTGSCNVQWDVLIGSGPPCSYEEVPTYSGIAAPLHATLTPVRAAEGWVARMEGIEHTVTSPRPLGVSFPGPEVSWHADIDIPLAPATDGAGASGSVRWAGDCVGVCTGAAIPATTAYAVSIDRSTGRASFEVNGYLPTMPHLSGCWRNNASLSCSFTASP